MQCIAFDAHKQYTWALVEDEKGKVVREERVAHRKGALIDFLVRHATRRILCCVDSEEMTPTHRTTGKQGATLGKEAIRDFHT